MQDDLTNRMATTRRRAGPQPKPTTPPSEPEPAHVVEIPQPPRLGIRCKGCGVDVMPRRDRVSNGKSYASCPRCGVRMVMTFDERGRPATIRLV